MGYHSDIKIMHCGFMVLDVRNPDCRWQQKTLKNKKYGRKSKKSS